MKLFYHHVGIVGADRDFPRTIFADIPLELVAETIGADTDRKDEILSQLEGLFPQGTFNCWGVPPGAWPVIKDLRSKDVVLLVRTTNSQDDIPALARVEAFWPIELPSLSGRLWTNSKYTYIFFFNTHRLNLSWSQFLADIDYHPNYTPQGNFYKVADSRWPKTRFGTIEKYVDNVLEKFSAFSALTISETRSLYLADELGGDLDVEAARVELQYLKSLVDHPPTLTSPTEPVTVHITQIPRSVAFRMGVKQNYDARCAVCGLTLKTPQGHSEVQSAHIYPKGLAGSDDLRNGIALCRMHHWALDAGWFTLTDNYILIARANLPQTEDYAFVARYNGQRITLPSDTRFAPSSIFLEAHRKLHGFE